MAFDGQERKIVLPSVRDASKSYDDIHDWHIPPPCKVWDFVAQFVSRLATDRAACFSSSFELNAVDNTHRLHFFTIQML